MAITKCVAVMRFTVCRLVVLNIIVSAYENALIKDINAIRTEMNHKLLLYGGVCMKHTRVLIMVHIEYW